MTNCTTTRLVISLTAIGIALGTPTYAEDKAASKSNEVKLVAVQVDAYNAKDLDGFLATYNDDAGLYDLAADKILAFGEVDFRKRYTDRFTNSPDLHATIRKRLAGGSYVIAWESVVKKVVVYNVVDGEIRRTWVLLEIGQNRQWL